MTYKNNDIMTTTPPYSKLAMIYDRLMDHVDYDLWSEYILKLLGLSPAKIDSLIDLSCGTGSLLYYLDKIIPDVYGCDISAEMIYEAKTKKNLDPGIIFINDLQNIAVKSNSFDSALVLYDSLNYLVDEGSLGKSLVEIHRILKPDGVFIFDVVSENHCLEHYLDYHESEYWGDDGYSRHSYYDSKNGYQYNDFRIVLKGQTYIERHTQKIYGLDDLRSALADNSFKVIGTYEDFTNDYSSENAGRFHFLCLKI
jgi:SAM-dependent methyltransferase